MVMKQPQQSRHQAKRRKLDHHEHDHSQLDALYIQRRLVERQDTLCAQHRRYTGCWAGVKHLVNFEYSRRLKLLQDFKTSTLGYVAHVKKSCDLKFHVLKTQLQCDIGVVQSARIKGTMSHDVCEKLALVTRSKKPLAINIMPTIGFGDGKSAARLRLTEMRFAGLRELINATGHRCFSPDITNLVISYIVACPEFKDEQQTLSNLPKIKNMTCVVGLSDGQIAIGVGHGYIYVCGSQTGAQLRKLEAHSSYVRSLAAVDGNRLLSGSWDKTLCLWDLDSGRCIHIFKGHKEYVTCVCVFSGLNGVVRAASCSDDKTIRIWDLEFGVCLRVLRGHTSCIQSVAGTNDGVLVSGSRDGEIRIWDVVAGKCTRVIKENTAWVRSIIVLRDQKRVVTASLDNTLCVWDIETGKCIKVLRGHTGCIESVYAFADGRRIVSGSEDKTMRVWDLQTGKCLKKVCIGFEASGVCCLMDGRAVVVGKGVKAVQIYK